jgi:osmotically-inducible protein OsmY
MKNYKRLFYAVWITGLTTLSLPSAVMGQSRGSAAPDGSTATGSGVMSEEDRTGSTGPSGTRSTSPTNTGAIDAEGRVAKPAGDSAVTEVDRGLAAQIRNSLTGNPDFLATPDNVHLTVNNGFVTLQGWVPNEQDRVAIAAHVQKQTGVQGVNNRLRVRPAADVRSNR